MSFRRCAFETCAHLVSTGGCEEEVRSRFEAPAFHSRGCRFQSWPGYEPSWDRFLMAGLGTLRHKQVQCLSLTSVPSQLIIH